MPERPTYPDWLLNAFQNSGIPEFVEFAEDARTTRPASQPSPRRLTSPQRRILLASYRLTEAPRSRLGRRLQLKDEGDSSAGTPLELTLAPGQRQMWEFEILFAGSALGVHRLKTTAIQQQELGRLAQTLSSELNWGELGLPDRWEWTEYGESGGFVGRFDRSVSLEADHIDEILFTVLERCRNERWSQSIAQVLAAVEPATDTADRGNQRATAHDPGQSGTQVAQAPVEADLNLEMHYSTERCGEAAVGTRLRIKDGRSGELPDALALYRSRNVHWTLEVAFASSTLGRPSTEASAEQQRKLATLASDWLTAVTPLLSSAYQELRVGDWISYAEHSRGCFQITMEARRTLDEAERIALLKRVVQTAVKSGLRPQLQQVLTQSGHQSTDPVAQPMIDTAGPLEMQGSGPHQLIRPPEVPVAPIPVPPRQLAAVRYVTRELAPLVRTTLWPAGRRMTFDADLLQTFDSPVQAVEYQTLSTGSALSILFNAEGEYDQSFKALTGLENQLSLFFLIWCSGLAEFFHRDRFTGVSVVLADPVRLQFNYSAALAEGVVDDLMQYMAFQVITAPAVRDLIRHLLVEQVEEEPESEEDDPEDALTVMLRDAGFEVQPPGDEDGFHHLTWDEQGREMQAGVRWQLPTDLCPYPLLMVLAGEVMSERAELLAAAFQDHYGKYSMDGLTMLQYSSTAWLLARTLPPLIIPNGEENAPLLVAATWPLLGPLNAPVLRYLIRSAVQILPYLQLASGGKEEVSTEHPGDLPADQRAAFTLNTLREVLSATGLHWSDYGRTVGVQYQLPLEGRDTPLTLAIEMRVVGTDAFTPCIALRGYTVSGAPKVGLDGIVQYNLELGRLTGRANSAFFLPVSLDADEEFVVRQLVPVLGPLSPDTLKGYLEIVANSLHYAANFLSAQHGGNL